MRRAMILTACLATATAMLSCSHDKKQDDEASESENASQDAQSETPVEDPIALEEDPLFQLGMPEFCSLVTKNSEGCFSCTPRELPRERCTKLVAAFDSAKDCQHDLDQMTCDSIDFVWDFNERDNTEAMYERLPLVTTLVKALLASKLKEQPEKAAHATSIIDLVAKYRLDIFSGTNLDKVAAEGVAIIKKIRPETDISDTQATEALKGILGVLAEKSEQGDLNEGDVLQMLAGMFGQLPTELGDLAGLLEGGLLPEAEPEAEAETETETEATP